MLKIGDFSRLSRISVKALRYYDDIGLLKPVTVDRFTGYRYYSVEQVLRLNRIIILRNLGLSLAEMTKIMDDNPSSGQIIQMLRVKQEEIRSRLKDDRSRLDQVEEWLRQIEKEGVVPDFQVDIKKIEKQKVASLRRIIPTYNDIHMLFNELCGYLEAKKAKSFGPPLAIYYDTEYKEHQVDVELAVPIAGNLEVAGQIVVRELEGIDQAVCVIHRGPYETLKQTYGFMMTWFENSTWEMSGPDREVYLTDPDKTKDPAEYITELQFPVTKK
jgi:DNA-binding transcriptional MerR regulator